MSMYMYIILVKLVSCSMLTRRDVPFFLPRRPIEFDLFFHLSDIHPRFPSVKSVSVTLCSESGFESVFFVPNENLFSEFAYVEMEPGLYFYHLYRFQ